MDDNENYNDTSDYNPLFLAVHHGQMNLVRSLLKKNCADRVIRGRTLMHVAAARGHVEIMSLLENKTDKDDNTPLYLAIKGNRLEMFNRFLRKNNINAKNLRGNTLLHYAAAKNRMEFIKILIENGADVNVENQEGETPLDLVNGNKIQLAEFLIKNGAKLTSEKLLKSAAICGNLEMVKLIMANGWNKVDSSLFEAMLNGHLEVLKYLMTNGVKRKEVINKDDLCLFHFSIKHDRIDMLDYLINVGVKTEEDLYHEIFYAAHYECWKFLLKRTSEFHAKTYSVESQLHHAVRLGRVETVKLIISEQADDFQSDSLASKLAVHIAVETGNEEMLEVLLKAGYSFESCFKYTSPLHVAVTFENTKIAELLLKAGADVNLKEFSHSPLDFAAAAGQANMVRLLLKTDGISLPFETNDALFLTLKMFSSSLDYTAVTSSTFENLLKITQMLAPLIKDTYFADMFRCAIRIRVLIQNEENSASVLKLKVKSNKLEEKEIGVFRPELLRCLFNYLVDGRLEANTRSIINGTCYDICSPELLDVMLEYNDGKSSSCTIIQLYKRNYKCNLLLINYTESIDSLVNVQIEHDSFDYKNHKEDSSVFLKLIVARLVLLTDVGHSETLKFCTKHKLNAWRKICEGQKIKMKKTRIANDLKVSFLDILTKPTDILANYVRNEKLIKVLESSCGKFSAYAEFLKINVENGKRRMNLINDCVNSMCDIVRKNHRIRISIVNIYQIFYYLSVVDLRRLSAAFS